MKYEIDTTFSDLITVVIPPNEIWTLTGRDVKRTFHSGKKGLLYGELLGLISNIYATLAKERPTIKWKDEDLPFWGDHNFLELIGIDTNTKTVNLFIGS